VERQKPERGLTFDMSGDRPAQPVGHPLNGMVRRLANQPQMT